MYMFYAWIYVAPSLMFMLYMNDKVHFRTAFAVVHFDSSVMLTNCTCICIRAYTTIIINIYSICNTYSMVRVNSQYV